MALTEVEFQRKLMEARSAITENKLDKAERLMGELKLDQIERRHQGFATKSLHSEILANRLDFGGTGSDEPGFEVKTWYHNRFGDLDAGIAQVTKELYGTDRTYEDWSYLKLLDLRRYLKHGVMDEQISRLMLLAPQQIKMAVQNGVSVKEVKATMVEA